MTATAAVDKHASLASHVVTLWALLVKEHPVRIAMLLLLIVLAAVMEMAMLAAVVPLVSILMDSPLAGEGAGMPTVSATMQSLMDGLSVTNVLVMVVAVVLVSALLRILVVRMSTDFSISVGLRLQTSSFRHVLNRDYEDVVNQSSSENVSLITQKIQIIIANYIFGVLSTLSSLVSGIGVVIILVWFSKPIVLVALVTLAAAYVVIAKFTRSRLKRYGRDLQVYNPRKVQSIQEGLGGIRDVVMTGNQEHFVSQFAEAAQRVEVANARIIFYNAVPKPLLEAIGISSIAGIAWAAQQGLIADANLLPLLGVFALGMLRLLPYMQQMFSQWTRLVHGHPILAEFVSEMNGFNSLSVPEGVIMSAPLPFTATIAFNDIRFSYLGAGAPVLNKLTFTINKGEYIGIVGPTGSGKSTLVDMLMGLLPPSAGVVEIDGQALTVDNRAQWRRRVAHVPQKLFLTQGSIAANIAFGVAESSIDLQRVQRCARHAHLHDFIATLPQGFDTPVGEDGVRLSGGQRQRIGLARALYSDCDVLVLDEATNALDKATELAVVNELLSLDRGYTLIAIAHNISTVSQCHRTLLVGEGTARWQG